MNRTGISFVVCAAALATVAAGLDAGAGQRQPSRQQLDDLITAFRTQHQIPALSVAIGDSHKLIYSRADGLADVENKHSADANTMFRIASVTKPLTATLVLRLAEAGKLDLDAAIQRYCPQYPEKQWTVTARDLLSHVAGVPDYQRVERGVWWFRTPGGDVEGSSTHHYSAVKETVALIANEPLSFEPGTRFGYTNGGFLLLGCAVETATGLDFAAAMHEYILGPAAMTRTVPDNAYTIIENRARPYQLRTEQNKDYWWWTRTQKKQLEVGRLYNARFEDMSLKLPSGGWLSTASDLVRYANALNSGKLIGPQMRRRMYTERDTADGKTTGWGLGISVGTARGERTAGLTGGQVGASAHLRMVPARGFAVAVIANRDLAPIGDLLNQIGNAYGYFDPPATK